MNETMAATCIVVGLIALIYGALIWKKHPDGNSRWIPFYGVTGGLILGAGVGYLADIPLVEDKVGDIPVWLIIVAVTGFAFFLELKGWGDHRTRTPVLGLITALLLMVAVGHQIVGFTGHEIQNVRTTANVVPASAPKG
jgi:hypothetical protein